MFVNPVFITSGIITVEIYSQYARKKKKLDLLEQGAARNRWVMMTVPIVRAPK